MPATPRTIDFTEHKPGKKWEPGEHEGCPFVNLYHFHVKKVKRLGPHVGVRLGAERMAGGSTVG